MDPLPSLHVKKRDPVEALDVIRVRPGQEAPSWTPRLKSVPAGAEALAADVQSITWYHTIELPGGIVTPGSWDHRALVPHYGLPQDMRGMRALDVATFDGFWAFEMERRGAEVTAIDIERASSSDFPPAAREQIRIEGVDFEMGRGFKLAHSVLGSKVKRVPLNVYELEPARIGTFDIAHVGDLLIHLESPLTALRRIRSVTDVQAIIVEEFLPELADDSQQLIEYLGGWDHLMWTRPSLDALAQIVIDAGFRDVRIHTVFKMQQTMEESPLGWHAVLIADV